MSGSRDTAPIEEGETHEVEIIDVGDEGDGIARIEGFVVFVEDTEIGDIVEIEIETVMGNFGVGKVVD